MTRMLTAIFLSLGLVAGATMTTLAQTSAPDPQQTGAVIGQQEAQILSGFFNALNEAQQSTDDDRTLGDIVRDVIEATANANGAATEDDDDDADKDDDDNGKKNKNKNKGQGQGNKNKEKGQGRGKGLPPGLQRQLAATGSLPPGLQRQLEERGTLPPGLAAKGLPTELESKLPALPEGQHRVVIDDDLLIVEAATGAIIDALPNIIPPEIAPILQAIPQVIMQDQ